MTSRILFSLMSAVVALTQAAPAQIAVPSQLAAARAAELAKFEDPVPHMARTSPAGTAWDPQYRCFIQTDSAATSKGLPTHAAAAVQIITDAAVGSDRLQMHKAWVLFIKNGSQAYRPESATEDLKALFTNLVDIELGIRTASEILEASKPFAGDPRLEIRRNVVYGAIDSSAQVMDVYLVRSAYPTPVLVEFHGGGWRRGGRSQFDAYPGDLIRKAIDAGISVISVDYRMTPAYTMPAMTDDAARAVQFIRANAYDWNIDPTRIVAIGGSAGAHLAAWVALHDDLANPGSSDPVARESSRLAAFVDLWGPMDLTRANPAAMARVNLRSEDFAAAYTAACGCSAEQYTSDPAARARMRAASPLFLVSRDDPPALIVHQGPELTGRTQQEIPAEINDPHSWQHGVLLGDALTAAGVSVVRHISPRAGRDPETDIPVVLGFIARHLGVTPPR